MPERFPERLATEGIALERWRPGDEVELCDVVARSREHLAEYMGFASREPDLAEASALLERWEDDWRAGWGCSYKVLDHDGHACGTVGVDPERVANVLHVGYWLAPWALGRGLITRSVGLVATAALARDDVDRVVIRHDAGNTRSAGVPRRLGFARTLAETRDPGLPGTSGVTVQWEARRPWRAPDAVYSAKIPTGHEMPVPPRPQ